MNDNIKKLAGMHCNWLSIIQNWILNEAELTQQSYKATFADYKLTSNTYIKYANIKDIKCKNNKLIIYVENLQILDITKNNHKIIKKTKIIVDKNIDVFIIYNTNTVFIEFINPKNNRLATLTIKLN